MAPCVAALALSVAAATYAQSQKFTPPRLLKAELPPCPLQTVAGGGEVLIEAIVDRSGAVEPAGHPARNAAVHTDGVRRHADWRFEPARDRLVRMASRQPVDMPIAIARCLPAARPDEHADDRRVAEGLEQAVGRRRISDLDGNAELSAAGT